MTRMYLLAFLLGLAGCSASPGEDSEQPDSIEDIVQAAENAEINFTMHHTVYNKSTQEFTESVPPFSKRGVAWPLLIDDQIYLVGGVDESGTNVGTVERYLKDQGTWETVTTHPNPGFLFWQALGDHICTIGGFKDYNTPIRRDVHCFDTTTSRWTEGQEIPVNYTGFRPVNVDNQIYVLGGLDSSFTPINKSWRYDPTADEWTELAAMPMGFFAGASLPYNGKVYLLGGFKSKVNTSVEEEKGRDTLVYDIATDTWATAPAMPNARLLYGAAVIGNELAVYLGNIGSTPYIELYNPETETWRAGTDPEKPAGGLVYTSVNDGTDLYIFGLLGPGGSSNQNIGKITRFDSDSNAWVEVGKRPEERQDAAFLGVMLDDDIHFIGAHTALSY